jgi:ankyrin repeat protein
MNHTIVNMKYLKYLKENDTFTFISDLGINNADVIERLSLFIKRNRDASYRDIASRALRLAAKFGDFELVKKIVNKNVADINADSGMTLRYAAELGHYDITKFLLENGANVDIKYAIMWTEVNADDMGRELADKIIDLLKQYENNETPI